MSDALPQPQPNTEDVRYEIEPEGLVRVPVADEWATDADTESRWRIWQRLVKEMAR
jgi:hypothetical protein